MFAVVLPPILSMECVGKTMLETIVTPLKGELRKSISDLVKSAQASADSDKGQKTKNSHHPNSHSRTSMDYGYSSSSSNDSINDRDIRRVEYPLDQHLTRTPSRTG